MAIEILFVNDKTGADEKAKGSNGGLNVNAKASTRGYHVSREQGQAYSLVFDDASATAGDYPVYLRNDRDDGQQLVIQHIGVNCAATTSIFKLHRVSGTWGGGTAATPFPLNQGKINLAGATALTTANSNSTPMTTGTIEGSIDLVGISGAFGHAEMRIGDELRLNQGQAVAIELEAAASADVRAFGIIFFLFEPPT